LTRPDQTKRKELKDIHEPLPPQRQVIVGKRPRRARGHADEYAAAVLQDKGAELSRLRWAVGLMGRSPRLEALSTLGP
jgi:hypothetical protein